MHVLLVHNYYRYRGGEDVSFELTRDLLVDAGHIVSTHTTRSAAVVASRGRIGTFIEAAWGRDSSTALAEQLRKARPDVVHFHNTFPTMSPRVFAAVRRERIPSVLTLHNYRYACLNGFLFRQGEPCTLCVGKKVSWPGVRHSCYHDSRSASAAAAVVQLVHRHQNVWRGGVDAYVAPSDSAATIAIESGIPPSQLSIIPHAVFPVPSEGRGTGGYAVFAGRLSPEKGVGTLVHAWQRFEIPLPLKIAGTGPLEADLRTSVAGNPRIALLGALDRSALLDLVGDARVMVVPSEFFETFGLVAAESLAVGTPLIVSRIGALPEFVSDGQVGEEFDAGDPGSLAAAVHRFLASRVDERERRRAARARFEARYSPDAHLSALTHLYEGLDGTTVS